MSFESRIRRRLDALRKAGLHRRARQVDGPQGPRFRVDDREVLCLCSNNYLGLAGSPELASAATSALDTEGVGAAASRLVSGSMRSHRLAERALAAFTQREEAVLFSTGYAANVGALQSLVAKGDIIFSDALNHASLIDGARLSRARIVVFAHNDMDDLRAKLRAHRAEGENALVVSESLFSMDGDLAPLAQLRTLCDQYDAGLVVDDAHALGVFGSEGRGLCAAKDARPDVVIGTLGKAFGAQGAFAAGSAAVCDLLRNRARSYVFSTAPAVPVAALVPAAIKLVEGADARRARLLRHARRLREGLRALDYRVPAGESQILPVMVGDPEPTMALSAALLEAGVFAHGIRPPTVPAGTGRLRVVPMASHSDDDIEQALEAFARVRQ